MNATPDPVREHLDKAENWLALAEGNRGELVSLHEGTGTYTEAEDAQRWYFATMLESAKDLAELHRAMAQTINDLTPQRFTVNAPDWAGDVAANGRLLFDGTELEDPERAVRDQLKADDEAHQTKTLRPGVDPEPEAEGELWTTGDGWFYYAVTGPVPARGELEKPRWLLVRHYAQVLRWSSEQGAKPMPLTWAEVGESLTDGDVCGTLRRPTAEERAVFYGPEPDPTPMTKECGHRGMCDCPEPATLGEAFRTPYGATTEPPEGAVRFDATVAAFSDDGVEAMYQAVKRERTRRAYTAPEDRQTPRGGAAQWREG